MALHYLIGPVSERFATEHLSLVRSGKACLTFGSAGVDIAVPAGTSWDHLQSKLPAGWRPDVLVLNLGYTILPIGIETAGIPVIGYARDWQLHWHFYRRLAPYVDRFWLDARGAELFSAAGIGNSRAVVPFGRSLGSWAPDPLLRRDIDLLWVGNFNSAIHRDRLPWAARLARLGEHYRVMFAPTLDASRYRSLFNRARIAFLPSFQGGWDVLVAEALAAGTMVVRDAGVTVIPEELEPDREYVPFQDANMEPLLESLLADEPRCRRIATAGRARASELGTIAMWARADAALENEWDDLLASVERRRAARPNTAAWELKHWQALNSRGTKFIPDADDDAPGQRFAVAIGTAWKSQRTDEAVVRLQSLAAEPEFALPALLHLGEFLSEHGRPSEAIGFVENLLERLADPSGLPQSLFGFGPLRPGFDHFRVAWERAAFSNPNDPAAEARAKRILLRSRCELLLGQTAGDPKRIVAAATIAPELTPSLKAAATILARSESPESAIPFFEQAVAADPFDAKIAGALAEVLKGTKDKTRLAQFDRDRELFAAALSVNPTRAAAVRTQDFKGRRQMISLTLIVRDEEANLPACLDSARDLFDEIVVVDTGSTDRTIELARERGARIVPFAWCDDFAAARNAGVEAAKGEWILWLDADERLGASARDQLRGLFDNLRDENAAYMMRQFSQSPDPMGATTAVDQVRLFRNRPDIRWEYRIHEQILLSIRRSRASVRTTDIIIDHHGYADPALRQRKLERNTRLLEMAHAEKPEDPVLAYNLASACEKAGKHRQALPLLELCRKRLAPHVSIVPKVYRLLGQVYDRLGQTTEALETFAKGLQLFPGDVELLLHQGLLFQKVKNYAVAEDCFRRVLTLPAGKYPVGLDLSLRGYKTRHALAELLFEQQRLEEAEVEWQAVVNEQPKFAPGWVGLAQIEMRRGRKETAAALLDRAQPNDAPSH